MSIQKFDIPQALKSKVKTCRSYFEQYYIEKLNYLFNRARRLDKLRQKIVAEYSISLGLVPDSCELLFDDVVGLLSKILPLREDSTLVSFALGTKFNISSTEVVELARIIHSSLFRKETLFLRQNRTNSTRTGLSVIRQIGRGMASSVYLAANTRDNEIKPVVIKVIPKNRIFSSQIDRLRTERDVLISHSSNFLIKVHSIFQDSNRIFFVTEFMPGGDLSILLRVMPDGLCEADALFYFANMVIAVNDLHHLGFIHRDLKPENFLIASDGYAKLCDFGLSADLSSYRKILTTSDPNLSQLEMTRLAESFVGSAEYIAPEIYDKELYDSSVDVWSLGVILYELLYGHFPWKSAKFGLDPSTGNGPLLVKEILKAEIVPPVMNTELNSSISSATRSLITRMLCLREDRISSLDEVEQILVDEYKINMSAVRSKSILWDLRPAVNGPFDVSCFDLSYFEDNTDMEFGRRRIPGRRPGYFKDPKFAGLTFNRFSETFFGVRDVSFLEDLRNKRN